MKVMFLLFMLSSSLQATEISPVAKQYMADYTDIAIAEMYRSKIPASIKLAQGMLESDWGRSDLANIANNHFGIKCGSQWVGAEYYKEDDDKNDRGELIESCFRKFKDAKQSYVAHSDFLTDERKSYRYGFLFDLNITDYKGWARGLKKAGYATDPSYPQKLIKIIEQYDLAKYDKNLNGYNKKANEEVKYNKETEGATTTVISSTPFSHERPVKDKSSNDSKVAHTKKNTKLAGRDTRMPSKYISKLKYSISSTNDVRMIVALGGETIEQLSKKVGMPLDAILSYNEEYIQKEEILEEGAKVYLERKKRKLKDGPSHHIVIEGESMESISQVYGIRLKSLYAKNRMPSNSKTMVGENLFLKETASLSDRPRYIKVKSEIQEELLFEDDPTVK